MKPRLFGLTVLVFFLSSLVPAAVLAEPTEDLPSAEFVFEEIVTLSPAVKVGKTSRGERQFIPITGGSVSGPSLRGKILPGGWDWQLMRADGCVELEASYFIQIDDGTIVHVLNKGTMSFSADGKLQTLRTHPVFEAPLGPHQWLSQTAFIGTLGSAPGNQANAVRIRFYRMK